MYCDALQYSVLLVSITIVLCLPIEIECCFMTKPYYQNDPCYIQWQATHPGQLSPQEMEMRFSEQIRMDVKQLRETHTSNSETTKLVTKHKTVKVLIVLFC